MWIGKISRFILAIVTLLIIAWAFYDFGHRAWTLHKLRQEKPIELTILHWGSPEEVKIVTDLAREFENQHPDVRIVQISTGDFTSKIKTMMAGDIPPDVFYLPPELLPEFAEKKAIVPLDDLFAKETEEWKKDFWPILIEAFRYDSATGMIGRGKLYALPKDFTTSVMYINTDLFDKAGVDWKAIQKSGWNWEDYASACKKIRALTPPNNPNDEIFGGFMDLWAGPLRNVIWTFDGEFFKNKPDGTVDFSQVALGEKGAQDGLKLIRRLRIDEGTLLNPNGLAKEGGSEFVGGHIGIVGPLGCWKIPEYRPLAKLNWNILPVPQGVKRASQTYYTGWTMSTRCKNQQMGYELIRYLCGKNGQIAQARAGLAIPALQSVARSDDFLNPPGIKPVDMNQFIDAIPFTRLQQQPRQQEWNGILMDNITRSIQTGRATTDENAREIQAKWSRELASPLRTQEWPRMPWGMIGVITIGGLLAIAGGLWWKMKREKIGPLDRATERAGWMFIAPWVLGFLMFTLGPMVISLLLGFGQWSGMEPLNEAKFVGTANYKQLLSYDDTFVPSLKVTAYFVLLCVPVTQLAALAVAMLMNNRVRGIAFFRTVYFVPSVIGAVAASLLWQQLFNDKYGPINRGLRYILGTSGTTIYEREFHIPGTEDSYLPVHIPATPGTWMIVASIAVLALMAFGVWRSSRKPSEKKSSNPLVPFFLGVAVATLIIGLFIQLRSVVGPNPPNWFGVDTSTTPPTVDAARWAIPAFVVMSLWGVGGGMIIYLAGLKGIPVSLYEAATIDGAGAGRRFWNVTLPMLSPLLFYNFVMSIIGSFQVFTQAYLISGSGPENSTLFYVLQLYRQAFEFHNMGYASAMAWILFVIVLLLTLFVFGGGKKLVYYEGLR